MLKRTLAQPIPLPNLEITPVVETMISMKKYGDALVTVVRKQPVGLILRTSEREWILNCNGEEIAFAKDFYSVTQ